MSKEALAQKEQIVERLKEEIDPFRRDPEF